MFSEPIAMPLHLVTICIGFLIAFGLQQLVELFLRRRRSRKQQQAEDKPRSED